MCYCSRFFVDQVAASLFIAEEYSSLVNQYLRRCFR